MCEWRLEDGMTNVPSSRLRQTPPPKVGAEETKGGHSGRLTAEAGAPPTWASLALTYQGPCSLRLSDSLTRAAWPVSQIWNGCADLENTPPNLPQSCGKKPYAVLRLRIKKKKRKYLFFLLVKEAIPILNPAPPPPLSSSQPCLFHQFWNLGWLLWDGATLFFCILSHSTI